MADSAQPRQPEVTVLKSGIVDGMAYSLYSDGSIEAQMPEGMMRFASIDELRAHLDQRALKPAMILATRAGYQNKAPPFLSVSRQFVHIRQVVRIPLMYRRGWILSEPYGRQVHS